MAKLVSKTYGEALFELATEQGKVNAYAEDLQAVAEILRDNKEFDDFMKHPKINKDEKVKVIRTVFEKALDRELVGFLTLLVTKGRYGDIFSVITYFCERVKEVNGIGVATVSSAVALREEQKAKIEARLLQTTTFQKMEMHYEVNPDLIGGIVIRIGDRVVDGSIATKLNQLQKELLKIQLA